MQESADQDGSWAAGETRSGSVCVWETFLGYAKEISLSKVTSLSLLQMEDARLAHFNRERTALG